MPENTDSVPSRKANGVGASGRPFYAGSRTARFFPAEMALSMARFT